jgi:uncharacterized protein (TIGR04141 family)
VPVTVKNRTMHFVIAFGVGRHLLKDGVIEERFGLKVVLNSVGRDSFRSIDKTTLGSVPTAGDILISRDNQATVAATAPVTPLAATS